MAQTLTPVFGAAGLGSRGEFSEDDGVSKVLAILSKHDITHLDTAQLYGEGKSEQALGRAKAAEKFVIDTKWISGWRGEAWASQEKVVSSAKQSLEDLQTKEVDIFYLHSPDVHTPFAETLKGVNEVYQAGSFKRFGISNFTVEQTQEVLDICTKEGYVQPTVFQLSYSPVARKAEDALVPLLRKHKFALYAYSPISGGFLTKSRQFVADQQGRFSKESTFGIYHKMYHNEAFMALLDKWEAIANEEGVSKAELAYRWVNHHSVLKPEHGDAIIFGASKFEQIEQTAGYLKAGPLSDKATKEIDALWGTVKDQSIMDNFQAVFAS